MQLTHMWNAAVIVLVSVITAVYGQPMVIEVGPPPPPLAYYAFGYLQVNFSTPTSSNALTGIEVLVEPYNYTSTMDDATEFISSKSPWIWVRTMFAKSTCS